MLLLLPPSEAKTPGGDGPPLGDRPGLAAEALVADSQVATAPTRAAPSIDLVGRYP